MSRIQTNVAANNAYRNLSITSAGLEKSIQKLSSGFRINRASDDAAGLAIANRLRSDIRSLQAAQRNAAQATAMLQIADGAVNTISTMVDRLKELATQANSASIGTEANKLSAEYKKIVDEIDRIVSTTKYQGTTLLNGSFGSTLNTASTALAVAAVEKIDVSGASAGSYTINGGGTTATMTNGTVTQVVTGLPASGAGAVAFSRFGITVQLKASYAGNALVLDGTNVTVGATTTANFMVSSSGSYAGNDLVSLGTVDLRVSTLGLSTAANALDTQAGAQAQLAALDTATGIINDAIGAIGAALSRFDYATSNVASTVQNFSAAESVIRDADMAYEMTVFTKNQILQQAGTAMLAQANQAPQAILQLLRG
ncbi:MAG: flagellin [Gemmatimonadota bacterium]